jgi:hypothetical protein
MSDQWVKVRFDASTKFLGCSVEFRDGSSARVDEKQLERKLFRETRTRKLYNAHQMLSGFYQQTDSTPENLVEPAATAEAFEKKSVCAGKPDFNVTFTPGVFSFRANSGTTDIARIVFDVEFTVAPEEQLG